MRRLPPAAALAVLALLTSTLGLSAAETSAAVPAKAHRVVIQVQLDGEDKWQEVLTNIENLQASFGPGQVEVEVVAHGAGAGLVLAKNSALAERIAKLQQAGAGFAVCNRTCAKKGIKPEDLAPGVRIVPSGVAEVVLRQEQGWSYLKGGS
jgi:intracellular sulfur oxidation DsrE/DsrF family protein